MILDQKYSLPIIILLLISLIISVLLNFRRKRAFTGDSSDSSHGGSVSREKFNLVFNQRNEAAQEKEKFERLYNDYKEKFEDACVEIGNLKRRIDELTRDNNELNELYSRDPVPVNLDGELKGTDLKDDNSFGHEDSQDARGGAMTKYASFPRAAGSTIYFSDLSDRLVDDSYFELKISSDTGKASFRPLDFMKIRNYDPAMAAILTDGVKPNVASTVVGIEPGEVTLEGNDWIINKLAKVKLA